MTTIKLDEDEILYFYNDQLHRTDGPASETINHKEWFLYGRYHREDGPAVEWADCDKQWIVDGFLHRLDGPAIEQGDSTKKWYFHGLLHRLDGPAIEWYDGKCEDHVLDMEMSKIHTFDRVEWFLYGKLHRENGPAVEWKDGSTNQYWLCGIQYTCDEYLKLLKLDKLPAS